MLEYTYVQHSVRAILHLSQLFISYCVFLPWKIFSRYILKAPHPQGCLGADSPTHIAYMSLFVHLEMAIWETAQDFRNVFITRLPLQESLWLYIGQQVQQRTDHIMDQCLHSGKFPLQSLDVLWLGQGHFEDRVKSWTSWSRYMYRESWKLVSQSVFLCLALKPEWCSSPAFDQLWIGPWGPNLCRCLLSCCMTMLVGMVGDPNQSP